MIHAGKKAFAGPGKRDYLLPVMPVSVIQPLPEYKLESTFALDQLTAFANTSTKGEFIAFLLPVFGYDIPAHTYFKLYDGLRLGSIANAKIIVRSGGNYPAEFENKPPEIRVHRAAVERSVKNNEEAWELLTALLHEFGHYIDSVLRHELADKNPDGTSTLAFDSDHDEGAKYAYAVAAFDLRGTSSSVFAHVTSPAYSGPLRVNYAEVRALIMAAQNKEAQLVEQKDGTVEFFPAGPEHKGDPNSYGHENIEDALINSNKMFISETVRRQIYFGNWLRDNSQMLDPKIVRGPNDPKDMSLYLSRKALTKLVDFMAKKKFGHRVEDRKVYAVTEERLGVYRAVEHIDNPRNLSPVTRVPRSIDPDFEALPSAAYLSVNAKTCMKRYIDASKEYMRSELDLAVTKGAGPDGFRHLGAALHVLEDYFAHSNFVELSLRKCGYDVLPWTADVSGDGRLPIVTGLFASEDVVASLGKTIADLFASVQWEHQEYQPGKPTEFDEIALILLEEHSDQNLTPEQRGGSPTWLERYKVWMLARDKLMTAPGVPTASKVKHYTVGAYFNAHNTFLNFIIQQVGANIEDAQVIIKGDPNTNPSIEPSHSQLAKDHDSHHFHTLAVSLAMVAVTAVGRSIAARWGGDLRSQPSSIAASFIVHPEMSEWQDLIVERWAAGNPQKIERGAYSTDLEHGTKVVQEKAAATRDRVNAAKDRTIDYIRTNFENLFPEAKGQK